MNSPLRQARMERGISLAQVARDLGCSVAHLSSIETCQTSASPEFAERLARYFCDANINELHILYPSRKNDPCIPVEEFELLTCYRRMRDAQKRVLSKLAIVMARQGKSCVPDAVEALPMLDGKIK